ncbi:sugar phosphate isomerase/epimerase [Roseomonas sp. NAR14]|uniref:Sugar phosphate isomerase/epimerase n=1 Tax=Roseomonas acroporae TaxID=2937791 RepID=A0A9X2BYQ5_9PROT|nr:TIM barrel protein [Roseomonas acroporae]MCK8787184.1 sugar phosphate isomerase/epimerase [Roseomonas acroporae]
MRTVALAHLTTLALDPPAMLRLAARTGYDAVGLRLIRVTPDSPGYPLMDDPALLRATRAAMRETGVAVHDIEFVRLTPETEVAALEPFLAAGAELGARQAIAAPYDPDLGRLADRFGALCDLGARYGIGVVLEFFPWTVVPGPAEAAAVVAAAGRDNGGILVDTLHFDRSGATLDTLRAIPPTRLPFLHLCDAPAARPADTEGLLHQARAERLPPGEGGLDLAGVLAAMPAGIPVSLEVPMTALTREAGPEAVARRVREAARRVLEPLRPDRAGPERPRLRPAT